MQFGQLVPLGIEEREHVGLLEGHLLLVEFVGGVDHRQVIARTLGADEHAEAIALEGIELEVLARGAIAREGHDPGREGLDHADVTVGHPEEVAGPAELARPFPLAADRVHELAAAVVDLDLVELGVEDVEIAFFVLHDVGDQSEELIVATVPAPEAEVLLQGDGHRWIDRLGGVLDVQYPVDDFFAALPGAGARGGGQQEEGQGQQRQPDAVGGAFHRWGLLESRGSHASKDTRHCTGPSGRGLQKGPIRGETSFTTGQRP